MKKFVYNFSKILGIQEKALNQRIVDKVMFPLLEQTEDDIDLLIDTLRYDKGIYEKRAIAMSAPQIGIMKKIILLGNIHKPKQPLKKIEVILNPEITEYSKEKDIEEEGCLSVPRYVCDVERSKSVVVEYQNLKGEWQKVKYFDTEARIIQHEFDHLEGIHMLKRAINIRENPLWGEYMDKLEYSGTLDILKSDPLYQQYNPQEYVEKKSTKKNKKN